MLIIGTAVVLRIPSLLVVHSLIIIARIISLIVVIVVLVLGMILASVFLSISLIRIGSLIFVYGRVFITRRRLLQSLEIVISYYCSSRRDLAPGPLKIFVVRFIISAFTIVVFSGAIRFIVII